MDLIKIYIDEDAMDSDLVIALRSRNVTVFTPLDVALTENPDEAEWFNAGREHAGMILAAQQRFSIGEQLRRILHIRASVSAESMRNRIEFSPTGVDGSLSLAAAQLPRSESPRCDAGRIGLVGTPAQLRPIRNRT